MRIQLRCEHHFTTFYLKLDEVKGWLNIDPLPDESEEEFEKRAQEKVDAEFNRPSITLCINMRGIKVLLNLTAVKTVRKPMIMSLA